MNRVYWSESMRICWRSADDRKKFILMMAKEEIINEDMDVTAGLLKACGIVGHTGGKDKRKAVIKSFNCKLREEADIEEVLMKLQKLSKLVRTSAVDSHSGVEVIFVCETLNGRWATSGSEKWITAKDFLEYYAVKYVTATNGAYLCFSSARPCFFDLSLAGRVWNDNPLWVSNECLLWSDEEPLELNNRTITKGVITRKGTELEAVLKELEISRFKMVASKDDKVRRSQAKMRLVGKTPGSMEEKLTTSELNIPLKLARLNEIPDGPADMATVSSTVVRNLAKRKAIKMGAVPRSVSSLDDNRMRRKVISPTKSQEMLDESDKIAEGVDLRPCFEVEADLVEEQYRAKAREEMATVMDEEFKKFARALRDVQLGSQDWSMELEKKISQLEGENNQLEEKLTWERVDFQLEREKEKEVAALKLKEALPAVVYEGGDNGI
ncbi:hypothetical protein GIB67_003409 [Kingdonia uniflora]|uniref:Uncharacterized protein n=1 Tax=Kingdonia uniflora TaxID=39325 RepID=A0A7J7P8Y9_9MAGN|nr:hypothetical protein GIB67_003409 [Kingdonia uniflora]